MATTKKFLDLDGLKIYDGKIKAYADNVATTEASKVDTVIRKDYKVKNVDTTVNDKVSLTLNTETGKVGVTVDANVVKDSGYSTVKINANNSAAAWGKFLEGTTDLYPNNVTPGLKDLATDANARSYASTAKSEAITEAGNLDATLKTEITTEYQSADTTLKNTLIGAEGNASDADTIYGAKKYADEKAGAALTAATNAKTAAEAAQSTADTALANAATAKSAADAAQGTADDAVASIATINNTTIPGLESSLNTKIADNKNLIGTTKADLIGTENTDGTTIWGAKKYAKDLADGLTTRINSIVAGGVSFKGVVTKMPSTPSNGDLVIIGEEGGITVGSVTYKKDYEYIYSEGAWYELGDSDKNAKAIAEVQAKANANATSIQNIDKAYKAADTTITQSIETLSNAAVKSIAVTDNSDYVTVIASTKDDTGKVTLTVSDSIATTFDTKTSVDDKISTAKNELIGTKGQDGDTIWGAKKYTDEAVKALGDSFVAITADEINALFA